jgi:serine/threonine-protein kinase
MIAGMVPAPDDDATRRGASLPTEEAGETGALGYASDLEAGTTVGAYVIEEMRGRGGFATVYRARHGETGRQVAVKVLHAALVHSERIRRRFLREAEAIARLRHPRIVELLEYGEFGRARPYLVIEWLEGHSLDEELRARGRFGPDEAVELIDQVAQALSAAHAEDVVHRDLKAGNVMLVAQGDGRRAVKLLDFGIAKLLEDEARGGGLTTTGTRIGSPHCMAPEQILGAAVDRRTDVYALGILAYHLLAGRVPFDGKTAIEVEEKQLGSPPPALSEVAPVPRAVDDVIRRAMAKSPADRYASVDDLMVALRAALTGVDRAAPPPAPAPRAAADAISLHVRAVVVAEDPTDDAFDVADAITGAAREACREAGLELTLDAGGTVVGVRPLPPDAGAARDLRRVAIEAAIRLADRALRLTAAGRDVELELLLDVAPIASWDTLPGPQTPVSEATRAARIAPDTTGLFVAARALEGLDVDRLAGSGHWDAPTSELHVWRP